jgi:hypothetical protein
MDSARAIYAGIWVVLATVGLMACTTAETSKRPSGSSPAKGINYFLPTKRVKFIATRTTVTLAEQKAKLAKLEETARTSDAASKGATQQVVAEKAIHDKLEAGSPAQVESAKRLARLTAEAATAMDSMTAANAAVNQAKADLWDVQFGPVDCGYAFTAKFELLASEPDPGWSMTLLPKHSAFRDDDVKLGVQSNGLLSSANVVATDRTGDILVELAGAIAGLEARTSKSMQLATLETEPQKCDKQPKSFQYVFDPVNYVDEIAADKAANTARVDCKDNESSHTVSSLNQKLMDAGFPYRVKSTGPNVCKATDDPTTAEPAAIYYRTASPYVLTVYQCATGLDCAVDSADKATTRPTDALLVHLPQAGPVSYVPMRSSAFVKTVNDVTFQDGMLTTWNSTRPSEAMEFVRLPVKILKSILEVPATIFSLRVDHDTKEASLIESQQAQLETSLRVQALKDCLASKAEETATEQLACFPE